jgi:hypothetical protein
MRVQTYLEFQVAHSSGGREEFYLLGYKNAS